jgi:hypoxanthine phosphoribosyltransferase
VDATDMGADLEQVLIGPERLQQRVTELAVQIDADYADRELLLVGVLKGAVMVMADLARAMRLPVQMDWMAISSYGSGTKSSGVVRILKDLDTDITGRHVLVVEDIIDSGLTLSWLVRNLQSRGPASLRVCTLLRKPSAARVGVDVAYTGFDIPDAFVIGYGLDYAERYRNLPFIGTLAPHVYGGPARSAPAAELRGSSSTRRRGTQSDLKYVHRVENRRRLRRPEAPPACQHGPARCTVEYSRLPGGQKGKLRVGAGTQGSPAGGRRDLRLVRRGRPACGAAVHRWI